MIKLNFMQYGRRLGGTRRARLVCAAAAFAAGMALCGVPGVAAESDNADRSWRDLLFYVTRVLRPASSVVDSDGFFLAPNGASNPRAELEATVRALSAPVVSGAEDQHAICRFPRRVRWLAERKLIDRASLPTIDCKAYNTWRSIHAVNGATFVFASYFVNNPASMFGHTFLRLHRERETGRPGEGSPLLDFAVNFAANPTTDNALLYPILGVAGGFPGTFSLMPYYLKVQEYNNSESRDLWEYPLNLSSQQVDMLMETLWEVGPHPINYFYIDENCSYIMLLVLQTLDPSWRFGDAFNLLVTPADTLRIAMNAPGLLGPPVWRPSILAKYLGREAQLDQGSIAGLREVMKNKSGDADKLATAIGTLAPRERAHVMDAALDLIDYREDLAGAREAVTYKGLRQALLRERAQITASPAPQLPPESSEVPHLGHLSMRIGLITRREFGKLESGNAFGATSHDLDWQPSLHDIATPAAGYAPDLQILMFNLRARLGPEAAAPRVTRFTPFDVLSIPAVGPVMTPISWKFGISWERDGMSSVDARDGESDPPTIDDCMRPRAEGGVGLARALGTHESRGFALGIVRLGRDCDGDSRPAFAGGGADVGLLQDLSSSVKFTARARVLREINTLARAHTRDDQQVHLTWLARDTMEIRATVDSRRNAAAQRLYGAQLSLGVYY